MAKRFSQQDLIGKNFLQLNVAFKRQNPYIITDKPAMTSDSLLSSIGGALSLWLGMTVMFFFEIIEVLYVIIRQRFLDGEQSKVVVPTVEEGDKKINHIGEASTTYL